MQGAVFAQLYAALDIAVLERLSRGTFRLMSPAPAWLQHFYPTLAEGTLPVRPGERFVFLEHFLGDAELFWQNNRDGQLKSGPWREVAPNGQEYYLEAVVVCLDELKVLLLTFPKMEYEEKQALIQRARDNSLAYYRFHKDLQQKDVLIHCIVHDLSSPLTSIMLGLSLLDTETLSPDGQKAVDICLTQASRQKALIQEILDVFAVDVGVFDGVPQALDDTTDLLDCVHEVLDAVEPLRRRQQVALQCTPLSALPPTLMVTGDGPRLERVLFNLLDNALHYSPVGGRVSLTIVPEATTVRVIVDDAGPGVPPALVASIFDKFTQARARTGKMSLGLYFCRIMVEGWGGSIGYTPLDTGGARFWFMLPRPTPREGWSGSVRQ